MPFTSPEDIINRGLQWIGVGRIASLTELSAAAAEAAVAYPALRRAELRRSSWNFAARRAILRPRTATSVRMRLLTWNAAVTYAIGDVIVDSAGYPWLSTQASNIAITPGTSGVNPAWVSYYGPLVGDLWATPGPYYPGDIVYKTGSPAKLYIALGAAATQDPASGAPWHEIAGATIGSVDTYDPRAYAPNPTGAVRNLYDLPANFMRLAAQDAKKAGAPRQAVTAGQRSNDWEIENGVISSAVSTGPITFRFIADTADVSRMDDLFCEALGAGVGASLCETLTGNDQKLNMMEGLYRQMIAEARQIGAIEAGSSEIEEAPAPAPPQGRGG